VGWKLKQTSYKLQQWSCIHIKNHFWCNGWGKGCFTPK
jgi:hypothetical protein